MKRKPWPENALLCSWSFEKRSGSLIPMNRISFFKWFLWKVHDSEERCFSQFKFVMLLDSVFESLMFLSLNLPWNCNFYIRILISKRDTCILSVHVFTKALKPVSEGTKPTDEIGTENPVTTSCHQLNTLFAKLFCQFPCRWSQVMK